jgi:hypothetical protein
MKVDEEDLILSSEFLRALDSSSPQPSWSDIEARTNRFSLRRPRKHFKLVLTFGLALLAITACGASIAVHSVFFKSAPHPFQSAVDSFAGIGGPPGAPKNFRSVAVEPRRILTVRFPGGKTGALWVAPTVDGNYCFDTQVVNGDPDSPGQGLAWGNGYSSVPGCGKHDRALDLGYDVEKRFHGRPPVVRVVGGSGLRAAASAEVRYQDGSSTRAPAAYVTSPVDASFFLFQIPFSHTAPGHRPKELILRAKDNSILARDEAVFSDLWRTYDGGRKYVGWDGKRYEMPGLTEGGSTYSRPNSPRYQERDFEYPGNAHP